MVYIILCSDIDIKLFIHIFFLFLFIHPLFIQHFYNISHPFFSYMYLFIIFTGCSLKSRLCSKCVGIVTFALSEHVVKSFSNSRFLWVFFSPALIYTNAAAQRFYPVGHVFNATAPTSFPIKRKFVTHLRAGRSILELIMSFLRCSILVMWKKANDCCYQTVL